MSLTGGAILPQDNEVLLEASVEGGSGTLVGRKQIMRLDNTTKLGNGLHKSVGSICPINSPENVVPGVIVQQRTRRKSLNKRISVISGELLGKGTEDLDPDASR